LKNIQFKGHATELNFVCEICKKALKTADTLKLHKANYHEEKKHVCDICGHIATKRALATHMKYVHYKTRQCPYCEKCFGQTTNLEGFLIIMYIF